MVETKAKIGEDTIETRIIQTFKIGHKTRAKRPIGSFMLSSFFHAVESAIVIFNLSWRARKSIPRTLFTGNPARNTWRGQGKGWEGAYKSVLESTAQIRHVELMLYEKQQFFHNS